jgi:hypothetical protein
VPGTKSKTTVREVRAVSPDGLVAVMLSTVVPPVSGTVRLNSPPAPTVVPCRVVPGGPGSMFVAATVMVFPGAVVPVTSTEAPTADSSAGAVTFSGVSPCERRTYRRVV